MKRNILTKLFCLLVAAVLSLQTSAQEKMFLVKDGKIVATYGIDEVDYITFDDSGLGTSDDFDVEIVKVEHRLVEWKVYPSDPEMYYYSGIYTKESIEETYHGSVDEMAEGYYNAMCFVAGMAGMDPYEFMATQALARGEGYFGDGQLGAGSDYLIVVFGMDPDGKATTDYTSFPFSTPEMELNDLTVDFSIDPATNDVVITTTPSSDDIRYYVTVREYDPENPYDAQGDINNMIWRGSVSGLSPEEVIEKNTVKGAQTKTYALEPEFEYVIYAFSVTPEGIVNSEISQESFVTGAVRMTDLTFDLTVDNITSLGCDFTVVPSNDNDSYTMGILPLSDVANLTDDEIRDLYMANAMVADFNTFYGTRTVNYNAMNPDTEYVVFAFGYYFNTATSALAKISFKTAPASDPRTWEATYSGFYIGDYYGDPAACITINVNQEDVKYLWGVCDSFGTEEQIQAALRKEFDRYEEMGINYVEIRSVTGTNEVSNSGLDDGAEYKFYAVAVSEDYEFLTPVFCSNPFTMDGGMAEAAPAAKAPADSDRPLRLYVPEKPLGK